MPPDFVPQSPAEIEELEYAAARRAYLQSVRKAQRGEDDEEVMQ